MKTHNKLNLHLGLYLMIIFLSIGTYLQAGLSNPPTPPTPGGGTVGSPVVTTQATNSIDTTTATGNGSITALGYPTATSYGICWSTTTNPTISDSKVDKGAATATGPFTVAMTGLKSGTKYYVRSFATNSLGTVYGNEVNFTTLTVPVITWAKPSDIVYGTLLNSTQLNASSVVSGTFDYYPPATTKLNAGNGQYLVSVFTPTDATTYSGHIDTVKINVKKANPVITWSNPADIVYNTLLSATQLNATADVAGSFVYDPASGTKMVAGDSQNLITTFTPTDGSNYNAIKDTVKINVKKANPVITWTNPSDIVYGTLLSAAQLNATADVAGSFVYDPASGTKMVAGDSQNLITTFTPTDGSNYNAIKDTVKINVKKANPVITWSNPSDIVYGTLLSAIQLNATADVAGSFVYDPASGTKMVAGDSQNLITTFTPTDGSNYNAIKDTVKINVKKANPVITWTNPSDIVYGTLLSATQLNATADVAGSFVYDPASGTKMVAGDSQNLITTFTPTDGSNYNAIKDTVKINVKKANPVITWSNPADIVYNTLLSATQLNATADVAGSFVYDPASGTNMVAGDSQNLITTFTPTDGSNYNVIKDTVKINVKKANPVITWTNPSDIVYGTLLSAAQLNATADVAGSFVYDPAIGTKMNTGDSQNLITTFTPTDGSNYNAIKDTVKINVKKANPVITWSNPSDIVYGTLLSATQLNATADVAGSFVYDPASGVKMVAGNTQNLITTFTPTDGSNYNVIKDTVKINVKKANPVITWSNPSDIVYGTLLSATQLNATADVAGSFVYDPAIGTKMVAGNTQNLITTFTPTDGSNYNVIKDTVKINVTKANPVITWVNPSDIVYNTLLSSTQLNATADVAGSFVYDPAIGVKLSAGTNQNLIATFTPTDGSNYNVIKDTVKINVTKANPVITWANPSDIVYNTLLSSTQLNATADVGGSFVYDPASGVKMVAGTNQNLITTFTPTDGSNYNAIKDTVKINVTKANPVITWANPSDIVYNTLLSSTQLNATADVGGSFVYDPASGVKMVAGTNQNLITTFTPTDGSNYNAIKDTVKINVKKANPVITWSNPADIVYKTLLSSTQLNATADVAGSFVYDPASGTKMVAGTNQNLITTFTPTDGSNYNSIKDTVKINVTKANPVITWANPSDIVYNTLLSSTQLNATADVAGSFVYDPAIGVKLSAGTNQNLITTFTPTDGSNYNVIKDTVKINVKKANPVITWANPSDIVYGTLLSATQLNATADVAGSFVYDPASGTKMVAGTNQNLITTFTPTDGSNYNSIKDTVKINVTKANPVITWANPSDIVYNTLLSSTQLNATADVAGSFVYDPASGTKMVAGTNQNLITTFTPTDGSNYNVIKDTVKINVKKANPVITWSNPSDIVYNTLLSSTQLNATADVAGSFVYDPAIGTKMVAGTNQNLITTFTPTDGLNYNVIKDTVKINVKKANPVITWSNPADIVYNTLLSSTQLNATADVAGSFVYDPASGTKMVAGTNQNLITTFTPTDGSNYNVIKDTVKINVTKANPVITWSNPADIVYNTFLSATQLNATADVAGSFVYDPAIGVKMVAGTNQNLITTFTPTDGLNYNVIKDTVKINVKKANPVITWSNPADIVYNTLLSSTQLNATADVAGSFVYDPAIGVKMVAGTNQNLITTFTPTDGSNYNVIKDTVKINVKKANPVITWSNPSDIVYGTLLSATQLNATADVAGNFVYDPAVGVKLNAGTNQELKTTFTPTDGSNYNVIKDTVKINVTKANPVITWSNPADIVYNTLLSATQLNATADVAGSFVYDPAIGVKMVAGTNQNLITTFTPTDGSNYNVIKDTVKINVKKANPVITWSNPADIVYGTLLSVTQLNATADKPGIFVYDPAIGAKMNAGSNQNLITTFTPTDGSNYNVIKDTVKINVKKANTVLVWNNPSDIVYGTPLGPIEYNATSNNPGTFKYTPLSGAYLNAGKHQKLIVEFTPDNLNNYIPASDTVYINVNKYLPQVNWNNPEAIKYGTLLSEKQLNAWSYVEGNFDYNPPKGTRLTPGSNQLLTVLFTPLDTVNFYVVKDSAYITVERTASMITWNTPEDIVYGTLLSEKQLNATSQVQGTLVYNPALETMLEAGDRQMLTVRFTPTEADKYSVMFDTVYINVRKATPKLTWTVGGNLTYGVKVGDDALKASTDVVGQITYNPVGGTIIGAGDNRIVKAFFVPLDIKNYLSVSDSVSVSIKKANPVIVWPDPSDVVYGTLLGATQLNATASAAGAFVYSPASGTKLNAGNNQKLMLTFNPSDAANYNSVKDTAIINVKKGAPVITWSNPADISYGTLLDAKQLNATSSVAGSLTYNPAAGSKLSAADGQILTVTFVPTDATNYSSLIDTVYINVKKSTPIVLWSKPSDIYYGTKLSKTQLNATADVTGTFAYNPAIGTLLNAGKDQKLIVNFTPDDGNYNTASIVVNINVKKANPVIDWPNPADIVYGTLLSEKQLNAKTNFPGTYTYSPSVGAKLNAGYFTELSVKFEPQDTANVNLANAISYLNILKAKPVITWSTPEDIVYGTKLDIKQLNATADVPGMFVYTPNWGKVMSVGEKQPISLSFTPEDFSNYLVAYDTVYINVRKATGITQNRIIELNLYPNPATEYFSIEGFNGVAAVSVYDNSGKLILTRQIVEKEIIRLESLAEGFYFIKVETGEGHAVKKLLKR